jgi:ElaB/YqjD/DUF883 family membrane-anchored ribosome-binding protein
MKDSKDKKDTLGDSISSLFKDPEAIKEAAADAAEGVADYIRKHPYQSVGVSFAVGLLSGLFIGKKNKS